MKNKWILLSAVGMTLCTSGHALYVGNPSEPTLIDTGFFSSEENFMFVQIGYQGDFVYDRCLETSRGIIDKFNSQINQGVITLNFVDRAELYGSIGAMETNFSQRPSPDHKNREYQTSNDLTWGVGGRALLYEYKGFGLGVQGGYQWADANLRWDSLEGKALPTKGEMHYQEWQVALGFSYKIEMFCPYIGAKYSNVHARVFSLDPNLELDSSSINMHNRNHFGMMLGCSLTASKVFDMTFEARLIDEQSFTVAGNIQF